MDILVIDDVISSGYQEHIEHMFNNDFPWFYTPKVTIDIESDPNTGFSHLLFEEGQIYSNHYGSVLPIFFEALDRCKNTLRCDSLFRVRAGMFIQEQNKNPHVPHRDFEFEHMVMLYYASDSDGSTKIYNDDKTEIVDEIPPKRGRVVFFDGKTYHASASPKNHQSRIVINYNFLGTAL